MVSAKIEVPIGGVDEFKSVRATPLVPGLVVHKAPDCPPGEALQNITHTRSGLAIVRHLQPGDIGEAKAILSETDWTGLPEDFVFSEAHVMCAAKVNSLSQQQESRLAKVLGGRRQPASGARWGFRRDVITPKYLIEAKTTGTKSYAIQLDDLLFLRKQAYGLGKLPAYIVEIAGCEEIVVVPFWDLDAEDHAKFTIKEKALYTKKSFSITEQVAKDAASGVVLGLNFDKAKFLAIGYESFLAIAKKGIDTDADTDT